MWLINYIGLKIIKNLASVGDKLKNGSTVLACNEDIVLCLNGNRFVTWEIDNNLNAFGGDYFGSCLEDATEGYFKRICTNTMSHISFSE